MMKGTHARVNPIKIAYVAGNMARQRARAQAILIDILQFSLTSIYIVSRYVGFMVLTMIIDDDGLQQDDRGLKNHFYFYIE